MRRSIAIAVALVLIVVGLLGFATGAFVEHRLRWCSSSPACCWR